MSKEFKILMGVVGLLAALTGILVAHASAYTLNNTYTVSNIQNLFTYSEDGVTYNYLYGNYEDGAKVLLDGQGGGYVSLRGRTSDPVGVEILGTDPILLTPNWHIRFPEGLLVQWYVKARPNSEVAFEIEGRQFYMETNSYNDITISSPDGIEVAVVDADSEGFLMASVNGDGRLRVLWDYVKLFDYQPNSPVLPGVKISCGVDDVFFMGPCLRIEQFSLMGLQF